MNPVVNLRQISLNVPAKVFLFVLFQSLEFLDEVYLELGTDPHTKLEGDIFVRIRSAVPARSGPQANRVGLPHPFLDTHLVAVQPSLTSNCGEFAIIKTGIENLLPDSQKLDRIPVSK